MTRMSLPAHKQDIVIHIRFDQKRVEARFLNEGMDQPWQRLQLQDMVIGALKAVGWELHYWDQRARVQMIREIPHACP